MTDAIKVLGQSNPAANTLTDIYAVPGSTSTTISSLIVCNLSTSGLVFSVSVAVAGASDDNKQYIYFNTPLDGNDSFVATIGISLGSGDVIRVKSSNTSASFNIFGVEVS